MRKVTMGIVLCAILVGGSFAYASTAETDFATLANRDRAAAGLGPLALDGSLSEVARRHSRGMADAGRMFHNSSLSTQVSGWSALGENIGNGGEVGAIHAAFMDSPTHRNQILGVKYRIFGVGVVISNGTIWITQVFADTISGVAVAAPLRPRQPAAPAKPRPQAAVQSEGSPRQPLDIPPFPPMAAMDLPADLWSPFSSQIPPGAPVLPAMALILWVAALQLVSVRAGWITR